MMTAKRQIVYVLAGTFLSMGVFAGQARAQHRAPEHRAPEHPTDMKAQPAPTHQEARALGEMRQRLHRLMGAMSSRANGRTRGMTSNLRDVAAGLDRTLQEMEAMVRDREVMHSRRNVDALHDMERQMRSMMDTLDGMLRSMGELGRPQPRRR